MKLIGENLGQDLSTLKDYESYFNEGDIGELRLYVDNSLNQEDINQLEQDICNQGVILTAPIAQDARVVLIRFQKAIAPLLIIGGVVAAIIVGILGWQLLKTTVSGIPAWAWLLGGALIYYTVSRRKKWLGKK